MSWVKTEKSNYEDIADAIRSASGLSDTFLPSEMAAAISNLGLGTFTLTVKLETAVTPITSGSQNCSFMFTTGKYYMVIYSCSEIGSSDTLTLNSGFAIINASDRSFIAESHTNSNEQAPSVNTIFGTTTVNAHYSGVKTKTYREVKIGGYFA